jgi:hypothetical protein
VTATNRYHFGFGVGNSNFAGDCLHCRFSNRLTNGVVDRSLLLLFNGATYVSCNFLGLILLDAAANGVVDRSLLLLSDRSFNRVANCLVRGFFYGALNLVSFSAALGFTNGSSARNLNFFRNVVVNGAVSSNLLLLVDGFLDCLHDSVSTTTIPTDGWSSCADRIVAGTATTLSPTETGRQYCCSECSGGQHTFNEFHLNISQKLFLTLEAASGLVKHSPCLLHFITTRVIPAPVGVLRNRFVVIWQAFPARVLKDSSRRWKDRTRWQVCMSAQEKMDKKDQKHGQHLTVASVVPTRRRLVGNGSCDFGPMSEFFKTESSAENAKSED